MKRSVVVQVFLSIAAAGEILLVVIEGLLPSTDRYLPLGGSHIAQIGILFGGTFALYELVAAIEAIADQTKSFDWSMPDTIYLILSLSKDAG
jgi:hypothetical protein